MLQWPKTGSVYSSPAYCSCVEYTQPFELFVVAYFCFLFSLQLFNKWVCLEPKRLVFLRSLDRVCFQALLTPRNVSNGGEVLGILAEIKCFINWWDGWVFLLLELSISSIFPLPIFILQHLHVWSLVIFIIDVRVYKLQVKIQISFLRKVHFSPPHYPPELCAWGGICCCQAEKHLGQLEFDLSMNHSLYQNTSCRKQITWYRRKKHIFAWQGWHTWDTHHACGCVFPPNVYCFWPWLVCLGG